MQLTTQQRDTAMLARVNSVKFTLFYVLSTSGKFESKATEHTRTWLPENMRFFYPAARRVCIDVPPFCLLVVYLDATLRYSSPTYVLARTPNIYATARWLKTRFYLTPQRAWSDNISKGVFCQQARSRAAFLGGGSIVSIFPTRPF